MPRCVMCQSLPAPSSALYWHIGATTMRLASVRSASFMGENKALGIDGHMVRGNDRNQESGRETARLAAPVGGPLPAVDNVRDAGSLVRPGRVRDAGRERPWSISWPWLVINLVEG